MANLIYSPIASLDGYVEDTHGKFGWAAPDAEIHAFVNELERTVGTYLYGRRMYETMSAWETIDDDRPFMRDYAELWRAAEKVIYSRSLKSPSSARTRIERDFDADSVRELKEAAKDDISVGGAELAGQAIEFRLVDEYHVILVPVLVGGGKRAFPDGVRLDLELLDERRFAGGATYLRYRQR